MEQIDRGEHEDREERANQAHQSMGCIASGIATLASAPITVVATEDGDRGVSTSAAEPTAVVAAEPPVGESGAGEDVARTPEGVHGATFPGSICGVDPARRRMPAAAARRVGGGMPPAGEADRSPCVRPSRPQCRGRQGHRKGDRQISECSPCPCRNPAPDAFT